MNSMHVVLFYAAFFMFMAVAGFADSTTFIAGATFFAIDVEFMFFFFMLNVLGDIHDVIHGSLCLHAGSVFQLQASTGRSLLQALKPCPINFEFMNYTIFISKCKGPKYVPDLCCSALTEFACPYADELNDGTNNCAPVMFSYINQIGHYPPGLFASECKNGKQGLACPPLAAPSEKDTSYAHINQSLCTFVALLAGFALAFLSS